MSDRKNNFNNNALSDVEKFLLLLADLKIIDADKGETPENRLSSPQLNSSPPEIEDISKVTMASIPVPVDIDSQRKELKSRSSLINIEQNEANELIIESLDIKRSPAVYPFPSLLDELPFLRDIQPLPQNGLNESGHKVQETEDSNLSNDKDFLPTERITDELETVNLIQNLLLGSDKPDKSSSQAKPQLTVESASLEDDRALHLLQDILVVPEIEDLRSFKISVEQKLGIVESQVNNPALMNKIKDLENLVQHASLDLNNFGSKLSAFGDDQENIPTEIAGLKERIAQLEHRLYEPEELVQLLLPIIAELLSLKVNESRESMCQAIMPIIAEVIFERSQLDRISMSHAIADLLPNAISEQIRNSPEQIAKALGPEVGAAIREQIRLDRDEIVDALAPEMGSAIKRQIDLERDSMVDALYPVIGNTIAKYFAEAIRSINEKVEQTFSVEGVRRKVRAKMQGVSEAELILKESAPFEVQAIFLIHNLSGLVMIDIQKSDLDSLTDPIDSDMLAGMLTAIRSFANECMSRTSDDNAEIDAINYSGSKILLEVAGYCYLAVIVRGEPDLAFVTKIRDVFGQVVQVHGDRLKKFDGDPSIIPVKVQNELKTLMEVEKTKPHTRSSKTVVIMGLALLALIFVPLGIYQYQSQRDRQIEARVLEAFANTPELAVYRLNVEASGDRIKLSGKLPNQNLRDRALQITNEATKSEIKIANISNNIYAVNVPPDPILVANEVQRLTKVINYTQGVNINSQFKDGQVTITGKIEQPSMVPKITQTFIKISGVTSVTNATTILIPKLSTRIYFPFGVTTLQPIDGEKLIEIQAFLDMYPDFNIKIFTKSDNVGDRSINYQLGIKRCQAVRDFLLQRGVNANRLHISGIIESSIQQPSDQLARWVEFEPTLK